MNFYNLKISIIGIPRLYRVIEVSGNATLEDLHEAIFDAFDRYDPHLYSFFVTREDTKSLRSIYNAPEITHPMNTENSMGFGPRKRSAAKTRLDDLDLAEKEVIHYLFDFGDDWWHRIRVDKILDSPGRRKSVKLIKAVGKSPDQYPDYDEEDEEF
ncbi:MAG: plasmid pRiA4b ORF-3 family protein [Desulfobacterales bacterium]